MYIVYIVYFVPTTILLVIKQNIDDSEQKNIENVWKLKESKNQSMTSVWTLFKCC